VLLVKLLTQLTKNQCETEGDGDIEGGYGNTYPGESGDRLKGVVIESDYGGRGGHDDCRVEGWAESD